MSEASDILKPGENIRPVIDTDKCKTLIKHLYGLNCKEIQELNAYDDKNFKIIVGESYENDFIPNVCPDGYVLKILNKLDSQKISFIEAQTALMLFLDKNNVKCSRPVMNKNGKYYSLETLENSSKYIVRLLEYIPGKILCEVTCSQQLLYDVGKFLANMDLALQNFYHEAYKTHRTLWMLECVPDLRKFDYILTNEEDKKLVEEVVDEFEKTVLASTNSFKKTIIHGDFNEQNIIVKQLDNSYKVDAVLDFGDTQYSYIIFELAVATTYMILHSRDISSAAHVVAGYKNTKPISDNEFKLLKVCVAARLCQSLVLGLYSHTLDPDNKYLLTTQEIGWEMLRKIWHMPTEELYEKWNTIIASYSKNASLK